MKRHLPAFFAFLALALVLIGRPQTARTDDYVAVRGFYYREASTRVIQPMVELERDSPSGVDVGAHFLLDAITSASVAAGTDVDRVFTETRSEAGLRIRKRWQRTDLTAAYRYSAESDYWSHTVGLSLGQRFWGDTGTVRLSVGRSLDSMTARGRIPDCRPMMPSPSCSLDVWFASAVYTQVLSPVFIAQLSYDAAYLEGFQGNLYRSVPVPGLGYEVLPERRLRNAIAPRIAYYIPSTGTGLQLHYRFYWDFYPGQSESGSEPWGLLAHTVEGRIYQQLTENLELRLLYRQHVQNKANFWCDFFANRSCYTPGQAVYFSTDPKLGPVHTEYPEVKLVWDAVALADIPFFRWFAAGSFEISYGYYFQNNAFGNAHVLQSGYRVPY